MVRKNLENSFPELSTSELRKIEKSFYNRFVEYIFETLKAVTISEKELLRRVNFVNVDDVRPLAQSNQTIVVIASHQFNWELALLAGCVVLPFPVDAVYKKLANPKMDKLMLDTRSRFKGRPIEMKRVLREMVRTKDRLRALGIVADQSPKSVSPKKWLTFMGQDTAFFLGPEQLAKLGNYPAYFFKVVRKKRGFYTVELVKLCEPPYDKDSYVVLEAYAKATEDLVHSDPAGYLWSHKRWKLKKEG